MFATLETLGEEKIERVKETLARIPGSSRAEPHLYEDYWSVTFRGEFPVKNYGQYETTTVEKYNGLTETKLLFRWSTKKETNKTVLYCAIGTALLLVILTIFTFR